MQENGKYYVEKDTREMLKSGVDVFFLSREGEGECTATAHIHQTIELLYVTSGGFHAFVDDEEYSIFEGDLIMIRSNSIHRVYTATEGFNEYIVIKIKPGVFAELSSTDESSAHVMRFILHDKAKILWSREEIESCAMIDSIRAMQLELSSDLPASDVSLKIAVVSLLVNILRRDAELGNITSYEGRVAVARQIYKAITFINQNYERNISASDCAAYVNMSYSYFSRSFKDVTKKSFKQYLNEIRINHAEKELTLTDKSVTEICFSCGFGDVSYFIAQYKALRGKTPHRFRKEL